MKSLGQQTSKFCFKKSRPSPSTARTRNYSLYNQKISQNLHLLHSFLCSFFPIFFSLLSFPFSPNTQNFLRSRTLPHLSLSFLCSHPLLLWLFPFLTEFPARIQREVSLFFSSFGFYIRPLCSFSFHSFSHAFNSGKQPFNLETTLPNNSPHQFFVQADSFKFSTCFTTKDPYGFMVGRKEPKPRPKMDPQYSPILIQSLWAQAMQELGFKIIKTSAPYKLAR